MSYATRFVGLSALLLVAACSGRDDDAPSFDVPDSDVTDSGSELRMDGSIADAATDATPDATPDATGDGGVSCEGAVSDAPYRDRRDDGELTDPPSCPDCPGTFTNVMGLSDAAPTATTTMVQGTASGATSCEVYVEGSSCGVVKATAGLDPDGTGLFVSTVPLFCGENIVRVVCRNSAGARVLVRKFEGTDCPDGGRDLRLTLSWDTVGDDFELHLINPMGRINDTQNDCTWFTCMSDSSEGGALDWGVVGDASDNPSKDIDDTGDLGPENIFLENAPSGVYDVMVEYWGSGAPADGTIAVTIRETTVATLDIADLEEHHVWHVGRVSFPEGRFIETNRVIDCVMDWQTELTPGGENSRGCAMDLPLR